MKELSPDDLADAIELASTGYEDKRDLEIYQGIVEFGKKDVKQIMRPRLDVEAFEIARETAAREGLLLGISSGANIAAAIKVAKKLGEGKKVLTVSPDGGEKYLSTDLYK